MPSEEKKVRECLEIADKLCRNDKEISFLKSCRKRHLMGDALTPAQRKWLNDLYDRACALDESHG